MGADSDKNKIILARKRKTMLRKWLSVLWIFLSFALFALIIWGINFFYNSSYFKIKIIDISGNSYYKDEEILEKTSKFILNKNIFEIDTKKIESLLKSDFPRIKSAKIERVFPDNASILIEERKPFVILEYNNEYFLLDDENNIIEKITDNLSSYNSLLIMKSIINYMPAEGDKIGIKSIISAVNIYDLFDETIKQVINCGSVMKNNTGDIYFETKDSKVIIYGTSKDIIKKNAVLLQILEDLKTEKINYSIIDLRITDNPIVK